MVAYGNLQYPMVSYRIYCNLYIVTLRPKRVLPPALQNIQREAKNVAGVSILGIGEVDRWSCLGVGSLT